MWDYSRDFEEEFGSLCSYDKLLDRKDRRLNKKWEVTKGGNSNSTASKEKKEVFLC